MDSAVLFVTLKIVVPGWFRENLMGVLGDMTQPEKWIVGGDADIDFATDKATEMLDSIEFSEEDPLPIHKLPAGIVVAYTDDIIPDGWLYCDGQSVLIATYPELFAVIGTFWGSADGTHFSLPDLRKKFIAGNYHGVSGYEIGDTGGAENVTLSVTQIPAHDHDEHVQNSAGAAGTGWVQSTRTQQGSPRVTSQTGGGQSHENRPPYMALMWMISTGKV